MTKKMSAVEAARKRILKAAQASMQADAKEYERLRSQGQEILTDKTSIVHTVGAHTRLQSMMDAIRVVTKSVAGSWGVNVPMNIDTTATEGLYACTDFKSIQVLWPVNKLPGLWDVENIPYREVRNTVEQIKAAVYHEVGHCLYSTPPSILTRQNSAWLQKRLNELKVLYSNQGEAVDLDMTNVLWAMNALEDQRMEMRLVSDSPIIGAYLTRLVSEFIARSNVQNAYALMVGRTYLPVSMRRAARKAYVLAHGEQAADELKAIVRRYCRATTQEGMLSAAIDLLIHLHDYGVLAQSRPTMDDHYSMDSSASNAIDIDKRIMQSANTGDDSDDDKDEAGQATDGTDGTDGQNADGSDDDGDDDGDQGDGVSNGQDAADGQGTGAATAAEMEEAKWKAVRELQKELMDAPDLSSQILADNAVLNAEVDAILASIHDAQGSLLTCKESQGGAPTLDDERSEVLAAELSEVFRTATADEDPVWVERMTRGIVNPFHYRTKQPGNREFFRSMDGDGSESTSIAVSVLLDNSGSMHYSMVALSVAAYAIHRGCQLVNIPCTTVLWNDRAEILWKKDDDVVPLALGSQGGTDPTQALQAVPFQGEDKRHHLVFILTDGQWATMERATLAALTTDTRHTFLFGFGAVRETLDEFSRYCSSVIPLEDLTHMPSIVGSLITDFVGR